MGIPEKLHSTRIVYTPGFWAPGCLESGSSDTGRLVLGKLDPWTLVTWTQKLKLDFTVQGAVADCGTFNSGFYLFIERKHSS